eukprot:4275581-Lingulodinium_polyedra.AAC.1
MVAVAPSPVRVPGVGGPATRGKHFLAGKSPCFAAPRWRTQLPGSKQSNASANGTPLHWGCIVDQNIGREGYLVLGGEARIRHEPCLTPAIAIH